MPDDQTRSVLISNGRPRSRAWRISVDLTHMRAGGEQGGAKLAALSLVQHLAELAPEVDFTLLTVDKSHAEIGYLDRPNVRRVCMMREPDPTRPMTRLRWLVRERLARVLPPAAMLELRSAYWSIRYRPQRAATRATTTDLLFSPLTSTTFFDPAVPLVGVVYDLQHVYYPQFFSPEQRALRSRQLDDLGAHASRVVCISHHARETLLAKTRVPPERVSVVHLAPMHALVPPSADAVDSLLRELRLNRDEYLLYPANFWPHKNHRCLLEAFAAYLAAQPSSPLRLVCPGEPNEHLPGLRALAGRLGIEDRVRFPGYAGPARMATLLAACRALIFPSLFEGFGMPTLEAMAFDKPVLCSTATSLPEVVGDAALLFDPTDPRAIADAIRQIDTDPGLRDQLVERGRRRLPVFGTPRRMAEQHLAIFQDVLAARAPR